MLFGAMNAPMTFQRIMEVIFAPYIHKLYCMYLNIDVIFGSTYKHVGHLNK